MAGSSNYPTSVDNKTQLQDGIDYIEADNVNNAYVPINTTQTFIGANGKGASWSSDMLDFLANLKAPIVTKASGSTLSVSAGVVFIKNSGQTNRLMRKNTSPVTVTASDIDTGSMANATGYYVYAVADTAATTFTVKFSTSASSPTGLTNFELIGWFWNEAAGSLSVASGFVGNVKSNGRDVPNQVAITRTSDFTDVCGAAYATLSGGTLQFYSSGRPVMIIFRGAFTLNATDKQAIFGSHIDSTEYEKDSVYSYGSQKASLIHIETPAAGFHQYDIKQKQGSPAATSITQDQTSTNSLYTYQVIEL